MMSLQIVTLVIVVFSMNVLELFAGSRSFAKAAEKRGHRVFTSDHKDFENIDYVCDIFEFDPDKIPFRPDIIWASPPCTYFSVASIGHHWNKDNTPKTEEAVLGVMIVLQTLKIIRALNPKYFFIENPRGKLRKLPMMQPLSDEIFGYRRNTVTYCQYETDLPLEQRRMKPTDIWTNFLYWIPKPMCKYGDDCHQKAPRGSKSGTQGMKSKYLKSVVPHILCNEIIKSIEDFEKSL